MWIKNQQGTDSADRAGHHEKKSPIPKTEFAVVRPIHHIEEANRHPSEPSAGPKISRIGLWIPSLGFELLRPQFWINSSPATNLLVGDFAVVAGALVWPKLARFKGIPNRRLRNRNACTFKCPPSPKGKADVRIYFFIGILPGLGKRCRINLGPLTDFSVRIFAIVRRPAIDPQFPGLECVDDDLLLNGNAGLGEQIVRSLGQTVGKQFGVHGCLASAI